MNSIEQAVKDIFQKAAEEERKKASISAPVAVEEGPAAVQPSSPRVEASIQPAAPAIPSGTTRGQAPPAPVAAPPDGKQFLDAPLVRKPASSSRVTSVLVEPLTPPRPSTPTTSQRSADAISAQKIIDEAEKKFAGIGEVTPGLAQSRTESITRAPQARSEDLARESARESSYNYSRSRFGITAQPTSAEIPAEGEAAPRRKILVIGASAAAVILAVVAGLAIHYRGSGSPAAAPVAQTVPGQAPAPATAGELAAQPAQSNDPALQGSREPAAATNKQLASPPASTTPPSAEKSNRRLQQLTTPLQAPQRAVPVNTELPAAPAISGIPAGGAQPGAGSVAGIVPRSPQLPPPPVDTPIGGQFEQARLLSSVQPAYPPAARQIRAQGSVVIQATIDTTGRATTFKVLSGNPLLQAAAIDALRKWRYEPAKLNGKPVAAQTVVTIKFRLND